MEFLSEHFDYENRIFPVHLVLQSAESVRAGYDAAKSRNYLIANLTFDPSADFHEYRIDFVPSYVIFYADGKVIGTVSTSAIPTSGGHMILTHWSNGNPLWSAGPPNSQSNLTVAYVKAYFNSSSPIRQDHWNFRCGNPYAPNATCQIPDLSTPMGTTTGGGEVLNPRDFFFFRLPNATSNQTVYEDMAASKDNRLQKTLIMLVAITMALVSC